ncbi:7,8-dihydro-6-hydroxymethylpterin dimethyltransferase [Candidatus Tiddalikarchaeum anstoanum]|nr:7,8-dihydro-6-hydroxymethylpterin dimethyltransferase [Candidatus Tiddalikarchaeum anstoanum]
MASKLYTAIKSLNLLKKQGEPVHEALHELKRLLYSSKEWMNPFFLQLHITNKCNLNCKHCYYSKKDKKGLLTKNEIFKIIDNYNRFLKKTKQKGMIYFTGGEPLLDNNIYDYIARADELGMYTMVLTNGTLIDKSVARKLLESGTQLVQVSLEGMEETNDNIRGLGSFKRATEGIDNCVNACLDATVMMTISRLNIKDFEPLVKHCISHNVTQLSFDRLVPTGKGTRLSKELLTKLELSKFYDYIKSLSVKYRNNIAVNSCDPLWRKMISDSYGCCIGLKGICICENGDVMPCRRTNLVIDTIRNKSLISIWNSEYLRNFRRSENFEGRCGKCRDFKKCLGCRAVAKSVNGSEFGEDPQCFFY